MYLTRTMQYPIFRLNRKERIKLSKLSKCRAYKGLIVFSLNLQVLFQPPGNRAHLVSFYKGSEQYFRGKQRNTMRSIVQLRGSFGMPRKVCTSVPYHPRCNIVHIDPISIRVTRIAKNNPDL